MKKPKYSTDKHLESIKDTAMAMYQLLVRIRDDGDLDDSEASRLINEVLAKADKGIES